MPAPGNADSLDAALDELYGVDPADFVDTRKRLAADLRAAGDKDAAKSVQAARRPTTAAWALNQLRRTDPDLVDAFLDRSRELQAAQTGALAGGRETMRDATRAQRQALADATDAAIAALGDRATDGFRTQIVSTLHAASADDAVGEQLRQGRLVRELTGSTGFPDGPNLTLVPDLEQPAPPATSEAPEARTRQPARPPIRGRPTTRRSAPSNVGASASAWRWNRRSNDSTTRKPPPRPHRSSRPRRKPPRSRRAPPSPASPTSWTRPGARPGRRTTPRPARAARRPAWPGPPRSCAHSARTGRDSQDLDLGRTGPIPKDSVGREDMKPARRWTWSTGPELAMSSRGCKLLSVSAASAPAARPCLHRNPPATPASFYATRRVLLVLIGALFATLAVAAVVASSRVLLTWDEPITRWVVAHRTPALDTFFRSVSRLASTSTILVLGPVLVALTWRRCRAVAIAIAAATLARPLLEFTLKELVDRPRPDLGRMVGGIGPSFPSGHVMAAVALWGLLPIVVGLFTTNRRIWWASVVALRDDHRAGRGQPGLPRCPLVLRRLCRPAAGILLPARGGDGPGRGAPA